MDGSARGESAADGTFLLGPLFSGELVLHTFATDEYAACDPLKLEAGDTGVIVRLARAGRIRGTVMDAASGSSVPAEIWVSPRPADIRKTFRVSNADEVGAFDVTGLSAGSYTLVARTSSGLVSPLYALDVGAGEELSIELQVAPGGRARLLVPDGQFFVRVFAGGDLVDCREWTGATTRVFPPGPFRIELADWTGVLATREATAAAGETVEVDLR